MSRLSRHLFVILLTAATSIEAQTPAAQTQVTIAQVAVEHIVNELAHSQRLPAGARIIVTSALITHEFGQGGHDQRLAAQVARHPTGEVAELEDVLFCDDAVRTRNNCRLNADVVFQLSHAAIDNETATIAVSLWSTEGGFVFNEGREIRLERREGQWIVRADEVVFKS